MFENICIFVLLGISIIVFEIRRHRSPKYDFLFFFSISYLVYFVLAPLHLMIGGEEFATLPNVYRELQASPRGDTRTLYDGLMSWLGYWLSVAGYLACKRRAKQPLVYLDSIGLGGQRAVVALCVGIGFVTLVAYMMQFSSPIDAIVQASLIRSGDIPVPGSFAFLMKFVPLLAAAAPLYLAIVIERGKQDARNFQTLILFALLALGAIGLITQGSRRVWMIYAMEFYFFLANQRGRTYILPLTGVALLSGFVLLFGDVLIGGLALGVDASTSDALDLLSDTFGDLYAAAWRDFTYTYQCFVAVAHRYEDFPRLFVDLPLTLLQFVPERLIPIDMPEPLERASTLLIAGIPWPLINEMPPGFLGFFWYAGYLPGLILGCLGYGWFGAMMERFLMKIAHEQPVGMLMYTWAAFCWGYFVREGSVYMILIERFHWLIAGLLLILLGRLAIRSRGSDLAVPDPG